VSYAQNFLYLPKLALAMLSTGMVGYRKLTTDEYSNHSGRSTPNHTTDTSSHANTMTTKSWNLREKLLLLANFIQFVILLSQFQSQDISLYVSTNQPSKLQQSQINQMQLNLDPMERISRVLESPAVCPEAHECVCPPGENEEGEAELEFMIEEAGQDEMVESEKMKDEKVDLAKFEIDPRIPTQPTKKVSRKAALIVTEIRSGSSFFGELFNYHPNVFYLYEPLVLSQRQYQTLSNNLCNSVLKNLPELDERRNYDQDLLIDYFGECNLPNPQFYVSEEPKRLNDEPIKVKARSQILNMCKQHRVCFSDRHTFFNPKTSPYKRLEDWHEQCESKTVISSKVVRVCALEELEAVYKELELLGVQMEIFYLVRDPRGVYNSKRDLSKLTDRSKPGRVGMDSCTRLDNNIEYVKNIKGKVLDGHLHVIQYEELAWDPLTYTERIYKILGLELTDHIREKIHNMTESGGEVNYGVQTGLDKKRWTRENGNES